VIDAASDMVNQVDTMASIVARVSALASHIGDGLLHVISSPMAHVGIMIIAAGAIVWLIGHRSILLHDAAHAEPTPKIEEKD
jgi:3-dehydroquinate dehydratase